MYICSNKTKKIMNKSDKKRLLASFSDAARDRRNKLSEAYAMHKAEQALKVIAAGAVLLLGVLVYLVYNAI